MHVRFLKTAAIVWLLATTSIVSAQPALSKQSPLLAAAPTPTVLPTYAAVNGSAIEVMVPGARGTSAANSIHIPASNSQVGYSAALVQNECPECVGAASGNAVLDLNRARLQAIVGEPTASIMRNAPGAGIDPFAPTGSGGLTPVAPPDACTFLPNYCGPLRCAPLDYWLTGGRIYFMADAIALKRDQSGSVPFAALGSDVVLRTEQRDFPFRYGVRSLVGITLSPWNRIEGLYLGLTNWMETASVRDGTPNAMGGTGSLYSRLSNFGNPALSGIDYNNLATIDYRSILDNVELNWRHRFVTPPWLEASFLFGARYLSVREQFRYSTASNVPGPAGALNVVKTGSGNDLIGAQMGGMVNIPIYDCWLIQFEVKGALCQNNAGQTTVYSNTNNLGNTDDFTTGRRQTTSAFVGDLDLSIFCQCTDHLACRFGYQALWIDGLALASQNIASDVTRLRLGPAELVDNGKVVYHGPHAGVTVSW